MTWDPSWYKNRNMVINSQGLIDQRRGGTETAATAMGTALYPIDRVFAYGTDNSGTPATYTCQQVDASTLGAFGTTSSLGASKIKLATQASGAAAAAYSGFMGYRVVGFDWAKIKTFPFMGISFEINHPASTTLSYSLRNNGNDRSWVEEFTSSAGAWVTVQKVIPLNYSGGTENFSNAKGLELLINYSRASSQTTSTFGSWTTTNNSSSANTTYDFWRASVNSSVYIRNIKIVGLTNNTFPRLIIEPSHTSDSEACKNYCWVPATGTGINSYQGTSTAVTSTDVFGYLPFPVTMISNPTLVTTGAVETTDFTVSSNAGAGQTGFAVPTGVIRSPNMITLDFNKNAHGLTNCAAFNIVSRKIYFDAEI